MTSPLDLSALEKATAGPWRATKDGYIRSGLAGQSVIVAHVGGSWLDAEMIDSLPRWQADTEFIAASRTALPALIARVAELDRNDTTMRNTVNLHATVIKQKTAEIAALQSRLATVERETVERCAAYFVERAKVHAQQATWMGPERQYYKGARIPGVEMSPMNGEAISYDREMAHAAALRALAPPVTTKEKP